MMVSTLLSALLLGVSAGLTYSVTSIQFLTLVLAAISATLYVTVPESIGYFDIVAIFLSFNLGLSLHIVLEYSGLLSRLRLS